MWDLVSRAQWIFATSCICEQKSYTDEKNYPKHKKESLALKWAVIDKQKINLNGEDFVVKTKNNPLTYVLTTAKACAKSTGPRSGRAKAIGLLVAGVPK